MKYEDKINTFFGLHSNAVEKVGRKITLEEAQEILTKRGASCQLKEMGIQKASVEDKEYIENKTIYLA